MTVLLICGHTGPHHPLSIHGLDPAYCTTYEKAIIYFRENTEGRTSGVLKNSESYKTSQRKNASSQEAQLEKFSLLTVPSPARGDLVTETTHAIWKWGEDFVTLLFTTALTTFHFCVFNFV